MRPTRASLLLAIAVLVPGFPSITAAAVVSQVSLGGELFGSQETVGGSGVGTAQIGSATEPKIASQELAFGVMRSLSGWTLASAESGRLAFDLSSSIVVPGEAPAAQLSPYINSVNNRVIDQFTVGPGMGPGGMLEIGSSAQVLLQVRLTGLIQQQGRPSGSTQFSFQLRAGPGTATLPLVVDFDTGGLSPPQWIVIDQKRDLLIDVTVGEVVGIDALMSGWVNGTAFDPGVTGTNFIRVDPIVRVSNAPGYELEITSEAGAPTTPLLEPPKPTKSTLDGVLHLLLLEDR